MESWLGRGRTSVMLASTAGILPSTGAHGLSRYSWVWMTPR
jgi:hypothetical protein